MKINPAALRAIRERSGLTERDLARLAKVSIQSVSDLELGNRGGRPDTIHKIRKALKVPLAAILIDPEPTYPPNAAPLDFDDVVEVLDELEASEGVA